MCMLQEESRDFTYIANITQFIQNLCMSQMSRLFNQYIIRHLEVARRLDQVLGNEILHQTIF
jgi:hypothetical protein